MYQWVEVQAGDGGLEPDPDPGSTPEPQTTVPRRALANAVMLLAFLLRNGTERNGARVD